MPMFLTQDELCEILKVDRVFLWKCRKNGMPYYQFGPKIIRYTLDDVLNWFNENQEVIFDKRA